MKTHLTATLAAAGIALTAGVLYAAFEDARFAGGAYDGHDRDAIGTYALLNWNPDYREERFSGGSRDGYDRDAIGAYPLLNFIPDYREERFTGGINDGYDDAAVPQVQWFVLAPVTIFYIR